MDTTTLSGAAVNFDDDFGGFAQTASDALSDFVNTRPVAATLAAAALGAGVVALISMAARDDERVERASRAADSASRRADRLAEDAADTVDKVDKAAHDGWSSLRSQLSDLVASFGSHVPSRGEARSAADSAATRVQEKAQDAWNNLRDQSQGLMKQVQPHVEAATDMARANPLWTSIAIGALGALLGSQLLTRRDD